MSNIEHIKKLANQLNKADMYDIVKIATIIEKIRDTISKKPEYEQAWLALEEKSKDIKDDIANLFQAIENFNDVITYVEIDRYDDAVEEIKKRITEFYNKFIKLNRSVQITAYYGVKEYNEPGFIDKHREHLPKEFDIEYRRKRVGEKGNIPINKPLTSFSFYKDITPENIKIAEPSMNAMLGKIRTAAGNLYFRTSKTKREADAKAKDFVSNIDLDSLQYNFKQSIIDGTLLYVEPRQPSEKYSEIPFGSIIITVKTSPFTLFGDINLTIQGSVDLIDKKTEFKGERHDLSIRYINILSVIHAKTEIPQEQEEVTVSLKDIKEKIVKIAEEVPVKYTELSDLEFASIMREGYKKAFGDDPSAEILGIGWAQVILESGRPVRLPGNNIGNIKATKGWIDAGNPYFMKGTGEFTEDGKYFKDKSARWRAYKSPSDGATAYWNLIGKKYKESIPWMKAGDASSAMVVMRFKGYYTAKISHYAKAVKSLYDEFIDKIAPKMFELKSISIDPPGKKLEVKDWIKDYNEDDIKEALSISNEDMDFEDKKSNVITDIDKLIEKLMTINAGPLETIVKTAIVTSQLPTSDVLVTITSDKATYSDKLEFGRATARLLKKVIDANVTINGVDNSVELQCTLKGSEPLAENAIQAICDCMVKGMFIKTNIDINATAISGLVSKYNEIDADRIIKNYRMFNINRICNG